MKEEMRKRLEEATENFRGYFLGRMNKCRKLKGKEPYSADNEIMDICLDAAELGYKEAIVQAKEWLKNHLGKDNGTPYFINAFEADMNKLWEGEK